MTADNTPEAYPWVAETFVKYLGSTDFKAEAIDRPSFLKSPMFPVVLVAGLVATAFLAYKAYQTDFVRMPWPWMVGSVLVFWWSVSGGGWGARLRACRLG